MEPQSEKVSSTSKKSRHRRKKPKKVTECLPKSSSDNIQSNQRESENSSTVAQTPIVKKESIESIKLVDNKKDIKLHVQNPPEKTSIVSNISNPVMDPKQQNLSREDVKAEREAKKLAKQMAKKKSVDKPTEPAKSVNVAAKENSPKAVNATPVSPIAPEKPSIDLNESSKSREDVKAEREAKKLAKQMAKMKVKDSPVDNKENKVVQSNSAKNVQSASPSVQELAKAKDEKSKAELRAERRAVQEAQRAAKSQQEKTPKTPTTPQQPSKTSASLKPKPVNEPSQSPEKTKPKIVNNEHKVKLFNHLYPEKYATSGYSPITIPLGSMDKIHPAFYKLALQYSSRIVVGSNARCIALLNTLKQVLDDYSLPPNVEFSRGFESHLAPSLEFLKTSRLPSVSMNNAMKHIKWHLTQLSNSIPEDDAKAKIHDAIDTYIKEQIEVAAQAISIAVCNKISPGDVILTYGCSSLIEHILTEAAAKNKTFRVIVVAAHPWKEGQELLRRLVSKNIKCTLVMISALSFVMREVNKVILGAGALLANGYVMARAGTAQVAMVASAHNVPVLVCCETHKFSERVQTDSFVYNEIGNPDHLIDCDPNLKDSQIINWRSFSSLTPLNLTYDVTPPDLVTAVVTELAILPCTSVPVILRMKPSEFVQ